MNTTSRLTIAKMMGISGIERAYGVEKISIQLNRERDEGYES